jgi:hypothetical protein
MLRLVQADRVDGTGADHDWRFDIKYYQPGKAPQDSLEYKQRNTPGGTPFPAYRDAWPGSENSDVGYKDEPSYGANSFDIDFEVCAVCDISGLTANAVLGCVQFKWAYSAITKAWTLTVPNGQAQAGKTFTAPCSNPSLGWNTAVKHWDRMAPRKQ